MVRIIRHFPKHQINDSDNDPLIKEEKLHFSTAAEDRFDNLLAGLTHPPKVASGDVAPLQVASNRAVSQAAPQHVETNKPAPTKLPSVEEFRFEEVAAKNMASKLAPNKKPRIKSRRPRYRSPNRDRWQLPDEFDEGFEHDVGGRNSPPAPAAPRGGGRSLFWSFCVSILIIAGTSAAFGFVQPLNNLLPNRMGDFLAGLSSELGASLFGRDDTSADVAVADGNPNSDKVLLIPDQPKPTAVVARSVPTTTIKAEVRPLAVGGDSGPAEQTGMAFATAKQMYDLNEIATTFGTAAKFPTRETAPPATPSATAPVAAPAPAVADPAANPEKGSENAPRKPALQQAAKADPKLTPATPAITQEPAPGAAPPAVSSLSAAQIDRLLARGDELLQAGDIASARLLFLRVAEAGDRRGAKGVGMTYDPRVYARLSVTGMVPDRAQAELWYKKAGETAAFAPIGDTVGETASNTLKAEEPGLTEGSPDWNAACARKYRSFEPGTGLYTPHSGGKRRCKLP